MKAHGATNVSRGNVASLGSQLGVERMVGFREDQFKALTMSWHRYRSLKWRCRSQPRSWKTLTKQEIFNNACATCHVLPRPWLRALTRHMKKKKTDRRKTIKHPSWPFFNQHDCFVDVCNSLFSSSIRLSTRGGSALMTCLMISEVPLRISESES